VAQKFERLAAPYADASLRRNIISCVENLENVKVRELVGLLAQVKKEG
jgi:hypothetical protein